MMGRICEWRSAGRR